jgi:hypothetical protein
VLGQTVPQEPQFCGSLSSNRQIPPQKTVPAGQTQDPETHAWPPPQARSQLPQWFGSVAVRTHSAPQLVCPGAPQLQTPLRQVLFASHSFPQLPQFAGSFRTSVQAEPHACSPRAQVVGASGWPVSGRPVSG